MCVRVCWGSDADEQEETYPHTDILSYLMAGNVMVTLLRPFLVAVAVSPNGRGVLRSLSIHHLSVTQLLLDKITILGYTPSPPPVSFVPPTSTNHDPPMGVIQ